MRVESSSKKKKKPIVIMFTMVVGGKIKLFIKLNIVDFENWTQFSLKFSPVFGENKTEAIKAILFQEP